MQLWGDMYMLVRHTGEGVVAHCQEEPLYIGVSSSPLSPALWGHLPNKLPVLVCSSQVLLSEGFKLRHRPLFHKLLPRHLQCLHKLPVFWILGCPGLIPAYLPNIIFPYLPSRFVPVKQSSRLLIFSSVILLTIQHVRKLNVNVYF